MADAEQNDSEYFLPAEFLSDDFFTESDEQNLKTSIMGTSPQSTLCGLGCLSFSSNDSPNGPSRAPSPPLHLPKGDSLDLLYAAVGQVERLNLKDENQNTNHTRITASFYPNQEELVRQQAARFYELKRQQLLKMQREQYANAVWQWQRRSRAHAVNSLRLPPLHDQQGLRPASTVFLNGGGVRQSNGTGVFLPRRVGAPTEPKKKNACSFLLPARVVQALNLNVEDCRPPMPGCYFVDVNEASMVQSNVKKNLHRRGSRQDWTC